MSEPRINPNGPLKGKNALVTGASRGIGEAIGVRLAMEGANVVVSARTAESGESRLPGTLHETVDRIRKAGGQATFIKADLAQSAERE
ncbi:MAG: SDR family NAD(P)-dependent oxidoreductase, partial [Phenylobacterium sp.]